MLTCSMQPLRRVVKRYVMFMNICVQCDMTRTLECKSYTSANAIHLSCVGKTHEFQLLAICAPPKSLLYQSTQVTV